MKRIVLIYLGLIAAVILLAFLQRGNLNFFSFKKTSTATIGNKTFKLILAKNEQEKIAGLSNRNSLDQDTGMLFIFDKKDIYPFWMKNMKFPIDIIYIDDDRVVDVIDNAPKYSQYQNASELPIYKPRANANYVLEVNAGEAKKYKIKAESKVTFKNL